MASSKRYTNIHTILDKVRKNEIAGTDLFSFSGVQFARRREVIQPFLHWLDETALKRGLKSFFKDETKIRGILQNICSKRKIQVDVRILSKDIKDAFFENKIPLHFLADLFNFYYLEMRKSDFAEKQPHNQLSYKMLERLNNPVMKILTNHYPLKTMVMVRSLLLQVLFGYALRKYQKEPDADALFEQFKIALKIPIDAVFDKDTSLVPGVAKAGGIRLDIQIPNGIPSPFPASLSGAPGNTPGAGCNQPATPKVPDKPVSQPTAANSPASISRVPPSASASSTTPVASQTSDSSDDDPVLSTVEDETDDLQDLTMNSNENDPTDKDDLGDDIGDGFGDDFDDDGDDHDDELDDLDQNDQDDEDDLDFDPRDMDDPDYDPSIEIETGTSSGSSGAGKGSYGTKKSLETLLEELLNQTLGNEQVMDFGEELMNETKEILNEMDTLMSDEDTRQIWEQLADGFSSDLEENLNKTDKEYLKKIQQELKRIRLQMNGVKQVIKKLLDRSTSYFSVKDEQCFVHLFDAESLAGLQDYELLHPHLRKLFLDDVLVKEVRKAGKIDVYVDISDSMNCSSGLIDDQKRVVTKAMFAKAIVFRLKEMDMLDRLYVFDNTVRHKGNSIIDVLSIGGAGGTTINKVIHHIEKTDKNSLVITDADDRCSLYNENVFFLGVHGAVFHEFEQKVRSQYAANDQWCIFDGKLVYKVNKDGYPIHPQAVAS